MDDISLLREYAANNSETAFAELVSRRIGFVYSAALRQVRDPHLAGEITQTVFIILAQKAGRISDKTILTGWFFRTTRFAALARMRAEAKRSLRRATLEKEFQMQNEFQSPAVDETWNQMSLLLDEALARLGEKDRQAVLLRFFENKSLAEVGNSLGAGEDTARKRVSRALEKLRKFFSKRGVVSTTALIAGAMSAHSVQAAPVVLVKSVSAVAIAKGSIATASTLTLVKYNSFFISWFITGGNSLFAHPLGRGAAWVEQGVGFRAHQACGDLINSKLWCQRQDFSLRLSCAHPGISIRPSDIRSPTPFQHFSVPGS